MVVATDGAPIPLAAVEALHLAPPFFLAGGRSTQPHLEHLKASNPGFSIGNWHLWQMPWGAGFVIARPPYDWCMSEEVACFWDTTVIFLSQVTEFSISVGLLLLFCGRGGSPAAICYLLFVSPLGKLGVQMFFCFAPVVRVVCCATGNRTCGK